MSAVAGIGNTMTQLGSDAAAGVMAWTAATLTNAWRDYPEHPIVDAPPATDPGPTSPKPSPGGPPGWFWPVALLAALGTWAAYEYFSPMPARDPFTGPVADPANDPLSTPVLTPTPTEDPSCAKDVGYLEHRAEQVRAVLRDEGDPIAYDYQTVAALKVKHRSGVCTDIIGAQPNLKPSQRALVWPNFPREDVATLAEKHAEVTVLEHFKNNPLFYTERIALGVTRTICHDCQQEIIKAGGRLISTTGAVWGP